MPFSRSLFIGCGLLALAGGDWPRFRGPNGTGIGDGSPPVELGSALIWKVDLGGTGNGSPVVASGRVYFVTASGDGSTRRLVCLDAATGRDVWSRTVPGRPAKTHRKNSLASSTPAVDGSVVVCCFWDGAHLLLHAYSTDGEPLWRRDLGGFASEHGAGLSPVIHGDRVFVNHDQDGSAKALAFDVRTGKPLWSADRAAHRACYSTPVVRPTDAGPELVVTSTTGIAGYDPATGRLNWEHAWDWSYTREPLRTVGSSIIVDGLIFAFAGNGGGNSAVLAIRPPAAPGGKPEVVWERRKGFPYVPTPVGHGEHLLTVNDRGVAGCYEARTGKEVWAERLGGGFTASPVLAGGHVYAVSEDGTVFVFAAGTRFDLKYKHALGETVYSTPALADGRLFVRGQRTLWCFGPKSARLTRPASNTGTRPGRS